MSKLDLKDAYFSDPLEKNSRQFVRFRWSENLYKFVCLCFGLGPAPRIFTKLLKVPMTILSKINIKIIICLDVMLLIGHSLEETVMSRDTVIFLPHKAIHLQVDNMVALTYLLKMGGTQDLKLVQLTKEIWNYLLQCGITLTAEYLPSKLNMTADWESRNSSDSSEWKLAPQSFQRICQLRGTPEIDLFSSRLSHQIKTYFSWRPDPLSQAADAFQQNWFHKSLYAFPPFCMIPKVLRKFRKEKVPMMTLVTPAWSLQLWYQEAMRMSMQQPMLLTCRKDLLKYPQGEIHPLVQNKTLKLVAWTVSELDYKRKDFERRLPTL